MEFFLEKYVKAVANFGDAGNYATNSGNNLQYGKIGGTIEFTQSNCGEQGGVMWNANLEWPDRYSVL